MQSLWHQLKYTIGFRVWGFFNVPLIHWVRPWVEHIDDDKAVISIPLRRRNKNHFQSMYMGVLATGADVAAGILAFRYMRIYKQNLSIIFKDIKGDFFRRCHGRTVFTCDEGENMRKLIDDAIKTGKRQNAKVKITVTCPELDAEHVNATFFLTLSVKIK